MKFLIQRNSLIHKDKWEECPYPGAYMVQEKKIKVWYIEIDDLEKLLSLLESESFCIVLNKRGKYSYVAPGCYEIDIKDIPDPIFTE